MLYIKLHTKIFKTERVIVEQLSMGNPIPAWEFRTLLTDRTLAIKYNNQVSETSHILAGVPHGLVLEHMLFIVYRITVYIS